jgi:spore maturation protein CgeB
MQIAMFGSSLVSAYWNGAATYYRGVISALHRLGHQVTFYESNAFDRQRFRDIPDPAYARVVTYDATSTAAVEAALAEAAQWAHVLIKCSGVGVFDELLEQAVPDLQDEGKVVIFWDVDAPATLDRMRRDEDDPFRQQVPRYDLVLTYGGGVPVVRGYEEEFGARRCVPVYNALDPETHHPVAPQRKFQAALGFLGNRLPDREQRVDEFFVTPARLRPDDRFLLGGSGWGDKALPPNVNYVSHVFTGDHNAFNCSTRAVLNVSRESMARNGYSPATRVFEAAGAAACLITDDWAGIEIFLEPGREVLVARSGQEVAAIMDSLSPQRAKAIGLAAQQRVLSEHTYTHRGRELEQLLSESLAQIGSRV